MCLDGLATEEQLCLSAIRNLLPFREPLRLGRHQHTRTLKKALPDRMPLFDRGLNKATHGRKAMREVGAGSNG